MLTNLIAAAAVASTNAVSVLPTIVIDASRIDSTARETPSYVRVIDSAGVTASAVRDFPSLVARTPGAGVMNLGAGNPALSQISMRGYGENGFGRVLVLVDGERLANPDLSAPNYARVPLSGTDRIEILHGPQTVLHGDGASAGMINVVTEPADGERRSYVEASAGTDARAGAAAGTRGAADEDETVLYFADFSFDRSDGWRDNSAFDIYNAQGGLRKGFANGSRIGFSTFFNDSRYDLPGPLSRYFAENQPERSFYSDHAEITSYGLNLSAKGVVDEQNEIKAVFTFSHRQARFGNGNYTDIYGVGNLYRRDYDSDLFSFRFSPQYIRRDEIGGFGNEFTAGAEIRHDSLCSDALDIYPQWNVSYAKHRETQRTTGALFAYDVFEITERLSAAAGARAEHGWNRDNIAADGGRNDDLAAYEASLRYNPADDAKTYLRWCRFFRRPFIDEYRWRNGSERGTTTPERGWNVEGGLTWDFAREWSVSFAVYWSETVNEIMYDPVSMSNENADWTNRRRGADFSIGWEREKTAAFSLSWSGTDARAAGGAFKGRHIPSVPRMQSCLDARVWVVDEIDVFGGWRLLGGRYAISDYRNSNGKLDPANIFRAGCRYRSGVFDGLTVTFSVENILDERYCDYAVSSVTTGANAFYPAAGRSFLLTVRYDF